MASITLPPEDLERLRRIVLGLHAPAPDFYPVQLTQLSTRGVMHNQTPYPDLRFLPDVDDPSGPGMDVPIYRFYMDRLIAHVQRARLPLDWLARLGNRVLGGHPPVLVPTATFEDSLQAREMLYILAQYETPSSNADAAPKRGTTPGDGTG